jgi:hypothetical protein
VPLYLAEVYFKEGFKLGYELLTGALSGGFPPGVTLKAGPWVSNEEAKIILVWARTACIETSGNSFFAAFDQATLAAIFAVGAAFGLAAHQATYPAKRHGVRILAFPVLHDRAPFHASRPNAY